MFLSALGIIISPEWGFLQMLVFLPFIVGLYYLYYGYEKRRTDKDVGNFTRKGFHPVLHFKSQPALQVNQLSHYFPASRSPRYVFVGQHESREVEIIVSQSLVLPHLSFSFFKTASSLEYQGSIITKGVPHLIDFLIIPKEFGDDWFVESASELGAGLPATFTQKYHIMGTPAELLKLPLLFFEELVARNGRLFMESKNNNLAVCKVGEILDTESAITMLLVRSVLLLNLLDPESALNQAHYI